jgi:EmrB/QacA subfamily drug resistance transporter
LSEDILPADPDGADGGARHLSLILLLCCTAQFMVILDVSIVNIALPAIRADLGFSVTGLQWVVNAYAIVFAGFLMLGGRAADLIGQRTTFCAGMILFALASLAGGLAPSRGLLIAARAVQGLGGAIIAPASLSIITTTFAEGAARNRAVGMWGAMGGAGGAAGSLLGGIITQGLTWRWVLLINLPIGIAAALAASVLVAEHRRPAGERPRSFDFAGALTVTGGLSVLAYGVVGADTHGWTSATTLLTLALGLGLLALFFLIESRLASAPLVPMRIFASVRLRAANAVVLALGASSFAMWYFVSLYLQEVLRLTPLGAGLAFLPMALTLVVCANLAGSLTGRFGPGPVLGWGMTLVAAGLLLYARIPVDGGYGSDVVLPGLLVSSGIGFSFVPATIAAVTGVPSHEAGLASGLVNTSRQMGGALGLAILASLATAHTDQLVSSRDLPLPPIVALTDGFHRAFVVGAGFAAIGALIAFVFLPGLRSRRAARHAAQAAGPAPEPAPVRALE